MRINNNCNKLNLWSKIVLTTEPLSREKYNSTGFLVKINYLPYYILELLVLINFHFNSSDECMQRCAIWNTHLS